MLDSNSYKKLQGKVGSKNAEVTQATATFALQGAKASQVRKEFIQLLSQRNIPSTKIEEFRANDVVFTLIEKNIQPNEKSITAVRIEAYGNDLLIDTHHFEASMKSTNRRALIGSVLFWGGLMFFWTGVGSIALLIGAGMLFFSKSQFADGTAEQQSSRQQYQTIMESLITALGNSEVDAGAQLKAQ